MAFFFWGWKRKETFRPACCSTRQRELHSVSDYIWSSLKEKYSLSLSLSRFLVLSSPYRAAGLNSAGEWRRDNVTQTRKKKKKIVLAFFELLTSFPRVVIFIYLHVRLIFLRSHLVHFEKEKEKTNTRTQHINSIVSARLLFVFFKRTRPARPGPDQTRPAGENLFLSRVLDH